MTSSRIAGLMANFQKDEKKDTPPPKSTNTTTPKWKQQQQATSVEQAKPVEQPKTTPVVKQQQPVQQEKPVEQPKQVVAEKKVEKVEEKKPVEQPKQVVEQPKQNTTSAPQKTTVTEQPKPVAVAKKNEEEEIDTAKLLALIERLEQRAQVLESTNLTGGSKSTSTGDADSAHPAVAAFDEYHAQSVAPFLSTINKIGGDLAKVHDLIAQGFTLTRQLIEKASKSKKPASDEAMLPHLTPIANIMTEIENVKNANRQSPFYNHLFALSEGMKCFAWVSVPNTPVAYVKEMVNSASFYSNKVLSEFRKSENGELHVSFVNQLKDVITNLADYVKEHHTTGLQFNPKGGDLSAASSSSVSTPSASVSTPQAKEPQQSKPVAEQKPADKKVSVDVLSAINAKKDSAATGLKKVTDDMKTKNRTDKVNVVSEQATKTTSKGVNSKYSSGTPKFELEKGVGEKWAVEFQQGRQDLVISDTSLKQNVYIYRCFNSVVTIQGKVKGIIVNDCKRVGIVVDQVVSSIEFVNCESAKLQINGSAPTVSVDKTDGFQLYLTKSSVDTKLVTSKSSEMNVSVPSKTDEDDMVEHAIPEQYVTTYNDQTGKFDTVINSVFM